MHAHPSSLLHLFAATMLASAPLLGCSPEVDTPETDDDVTSDTDQGSDEDVAQADQPVCTPSVSQVGPMWNVVDNKYKMFNIYGSCLPSTTAFWIANCANMTKITTPPPTSILVQFKCLPSAYGWQDWVVKDKSGGQQLAGPATHGGKIAFLMP